GVGVAPLWAAPGAPSAIVTETRETSEAPPELDDPLGRSTPRGAFEGYIQAVSQENYERAAKYLDLGPLPMHKRIRGEELARIFQRALDRNGSIPPAVMLNEQPEGQTDDNL